MGRQIRSWKALMILSRGPKASKGRGLHWHRLLHQCKWENSFYWVAIIQPKISKWKLSRQNFHRLKCSLENQKERNQAKRKKNGLLFLRKGEWIKARHRNYQALNQGANRTSQEINQQFQIEFLRRASSQKRELQKVLIISRIQGLKAPNLEEVIPDLIRISGFNIRKPKVARKESNQSLLS